MNEKQLIIDSSDSMEKLGSNIGKKVKPGTCIELRSDLGGGKTTFTRGFVRGMGSTDTVSSPTFTIGKQYKSSNLTCYHFDFYRLQEPGLVAEELSESLKDPNGVIIVEWADNVVGVLPENRVIIDIEQLPASEDSRRCTIKYPDNKLYLVEEL
jgi:tRNA threonylcarbamoyladenosine biosynthesis protein TsaE